jgi:hypothetical protein
MASLARQGFASTAMPEFSEMTRLA